MSENSKKSQLDFKTKHITSNLRMKKSNCQFLLLDQQKS